MKTQKQYLSEIKERLEKADCEAWRTFVPYGINPKRYILLFEEDADLAVMLRKDLEAALQIIEIQQKALENAIGPLKTVYEENPMYSGVRNAYEVAEEALEFIPESV